MCINNTWDRDVLQEDHHLVLLEKHMSICAENAASPPIVKAICQALPGMQIVSNLGCHALSWC